MPLIIRRFLCKRFSTRILPLEIIQRQEIHVIGNTMADCPISWYITSSISTLWLMFSLLKGPTRSTISSVWQQHMNYGFLLVSWPNINLDNHENISIRITSVWTVFILSITISVIFFQPLPYQIIPHNNKL